MLPGVVVYRDQETSEVLVGDEFETVADAIRARATPGGEIRSRGELLAFAAGRSWKLTRRGAEILAKEVL